MTDYTEAEQHYLDCIAPAQGIPCVGFEHVRPQVSFHDTCISWIDDRKHTADEVEDWLVRTLKREHIRGEFFLNFLASECMVA